MKFINLLLCLSIITSVYGADKQSNKPKKKVYVAQEMVDDEYVEIDFKDLKIIDFIKFVSKVIDKNILISQTVGGKVDFISTKPVKKSDIVGILLDVLNSKGYTLTGTGDTLNVVRSSDAVKESLPIIYSKNIKEVKTYNKNKQLVTEFIDIQNENVDVVTSKIRHLASKYGKMVTNTNTNTVIITDYPKSIAVLKQAIKILARDKEKALKSIKIHNIELNKLVAHMRKVINAFYPTTIVPSRVTLIENQETDTVIIIGQIKQVDFLTKYIKDLDAKALSKPEDDIKEKIEVIYLKNTESKSILSTLKALISKLSSAKGANKPYVASDNDSNSIIMIGSQESVFLLKKMIKKLDKEKLQVYVNVKIIEISKKVSDKIGAKYGTEGGASLFSNGLLNFALRLGGSSSASSLIPSAIDSSIKQGVMLGASIDFLVENSVAKVVSEPSIISINNKESTITVGETRSIITSTSKTSTAVNNSYKREDIGLSLKIKPRISNDSKVTLAVTVKLEDIVEGTGGSGTPTTTKREIKTTAIVKHGESVIIGGLVKRKKTQAISGINFLSTIPLIGPLFGGHTDGMDNVNLVIIMTPYIIGTDSSLTELRSNLAELDSMRRKYLKTIKRRLENFEEDFTLEDTN